MASHGVCSSTVRYTNCHGSFDPPVFHPWCQPCTVTRICFVTVGFYRDGVHLGRFFNDCAEKWFKDEGVCCVLDDRIVLWCFAGHDFLASYFSSVHDK